MSRMRMKFTNARFAQGRRFLYPIADMPYGDRMGGVTDPFGHEWYIASHFKDMPKK